MRYERKASWKQTDVVSDFDFRLRRPDSDRHTSAAASLRDKKRNRRMLGACTVHGDLRGLCDWPRRSGHCFLLVGLRPSGHFGADSDRRVRCGHLCRFYHHCIGQKNLSAAAKHAAGQLFRPPDWWCCEADSLYPSYCADLGSGRCFDHVAFLL